VVSVDDGHAPARGIRTHRGRIAKAILDSDDLLLSDVSVNLRRSVHGIRQVGSLGGRDAVGRRRLHVGLRTADRHRTPLERRQLRRRGRRAVSTIRELGSRYYRWKRALVAVSDIPILTVVPAPNWGAVLNVRPSEPKRLIFDVSSYANPSATSWRIGTGSGVVLEELAGEAEDHARLNDKVPMSRGVSCAPPPPPVYQIRGEKCPADP
jgi:hypothetical protein